jgi:formylglycine-generating enzyme
MFFFGDDANDLGKYAWHDEPNDKPINKRLHPVGQKLPNAWGLYDMHGNILEWCADWYEEFSPQAQTDPTGPATGKERVIRGGQCEDGPSDCRDAMRGGGGPSDSGPYAGFRVVVNVALK